VRLANGGLVNWGRFPDVDQTRITDFSTKSFVFVGGVLIQRGTNALIQFSSLILLKWCLPDWGVFRPLIAGGANLREYS